MSSLDLLSPVVDIIFKKIFGDDKATCLAFICAVLGWDQESIADLEFEFADKEIIPPYPDSKKGFLDVLVKFKTGALVNIEIQVANQSYYAKRGLFYWAHKYISQLNNGQKYQDLKEVISIHILTDQYFDEYTDMHTEFGIADKKTSHFCKKFSDLSLHFIELGKFDNKWNQDSLSRWCLFLKNPKMAIEKLSTDKNIKKAYEELERLSQDKDARLLYEARLKELRDSESALSDQFAKGIEQGREEGQRENQKKNARNMLKKGFSEELVVECTELSLDEVKALKQSLT